MSVPPYNKTLDMIPKQHQPKFNAKGIMLNTQSFADEEFLKLNTRNSQIQGLNRQSGEHTTLDGVALAEHSSQQYNSGMIQSENDAQ